MRLKSAWLFDSCVLQWEPGWLVPFLGPILEAAVGKSPYSSLKESHSVSRSCSGWFNIPRKWQRHQVVEEFACLREQRSVCDIPSPPGLFISGKHDFYGNLRAKCKANYSSLASQLQAVSPVSLPGLWALLFLSTSLVKEWGKRSQAKRD